MRYIGSKRLLAKKIIPQMVLDLQRADTYIEPFIGGCNMIDKINHQKRIGNDINHYIIAMWQALQNGWLPPDEWTREQYHDLKSNPDKYPDEVVGFVGTGCSYSGDWFGGYANSLDARGNPRNYCAESKRNVLKQIQTLNTVEFCSHDYSELYIPYNSLVYCDPPYKAVKYYNYCKEKFDSDIFWQWCLDVAKSGSIVYVSEYEAPEIPGIELVWEGETKVYANVDKVKTAVERLYKLETR